MAWHHGIMATTLHGDPAVLRLTSQLKPTLPESIFYTRRHRHKVKAQTRLLQDKGTVRRKAWESPRNEGNLIWSHFFYDCDAKREHTHISTSPPQHPPSDLFGRRVLQDRPQRIGATCISTKYQRPSQSLPCPTRNPWCCLPHLLIHRSEPLAPGTMTWLCLDAWNFKYSQTCCFFMSKLTSEAHVPPKYVSRSENQRASVWWIRIPDHPKELFKFSFQSSRIAGAGKVFPKLTFKKKRKT